MENDNRKEIDEKKTEFIKETVIHSYDMKKLVRRSLVSLFSGLLFGLAAVFAITILLPLFEKGKTDPEPSETQPETESVKPESDLPQNEQELKKLILRIMESDQEDEQTNFYENVQNIVASRERCLVTISSSSRKVDVFDQDYDLGSSGPGILVRKKESVYYALANLGNLKEAQTIQVKLSDGSSLEGSLVGFDDVYKIAIVSFDLSSLKEESEIDTIPVNTTANLKIADPAFAIGTPAGASGSLSLGFVSRMDQTVSLYDRTLKGIVCNFNVTQNGPAACSFLLGLNGDLYGIYTDASQNIDQGFSVAYAMDDIMTYVNRIIGGQKTASMGIRVRDIDEATKEAYSIPDGVYAESLAKDRPGYNAGIQKGDIICKIGDTAITNTRDYEEALKNLNVDKAVNVFVMRNSKDGYYEIKVSVQAEISED